MQKWAPKQSKYRSGFTIVELLIVVVVIAILAAITIIAYNGITGKAKASAAASAAESAVKKVHVYTLSNGDQLPADLATAGVTDQGGTTFQYRTNTSVVPQYFCVTATANSISYFANNTDQTTPKLGACPGHGANGATTVTNRAVNPQLLGTSGPVDFINTTAQQIATVSSTKYAQGQAVTTAIATLSLIPPSDRWAISAGQSTFTRVTVRNPNGGSRAYYVALRFYDGAGTYLTGSGSSPATIAAGSTATFTISGTAPANTASVGISVSRDASVTPAAGDLIQVTNVWLSDRDATFATGDSPGWAWNGAANNSTSSGPAL